MPTSYPDTGPESRQPAPKHTPGFLQTIAPALGTGGAPALAMKLILRQIGLAGILRAGQHLPQVSSLGQAHGRDLRCRPAGISRETCAMQARGEDPRNPDGHSPEARGRETPCQPFRKPRTSLSL
jgi:hypothetical protein